MKKQLLTAVAVTALMAMPSLASADDQGWYVRGNVGYGAMTDMDITGDLTGDVEAEGNVAASVGVGYAFGNNWRLELDGTQLWNDLGALSQWANTSASMRMETGMLNAIYDFNDFGAWKPYVGAGVGLGRTSLNASAHGFPAGNPANPLVRNPGCLGYDSCDIHDADTGTAWQVLAGLGYDLSEKLVWDTQYRYVNAGGTDFTGQGSNVAAGVLGSGTQIASSVDGSGAHILMTGLRYKFGAKAKKMDPVPTPMPAPTPSLVECWDGAMMASLSECAAQPAPTPAAPTIRCWNGVMVFNQSECTLPPPPPPPVPVTQYDPCAVGASGFTVYFPWDKSTLTDQARAVIQNATDTAKLCNITDVTIEGHADSSGSASYNVGLSNRRANTVESALRSNGLTASVAKTARGETALIVPTGDGVREPLNRRTEVVIRLVPGTYLTQ